MADIEKIKSSISSSSEKKVESTVNQEFLDLQKLKAEVVQAQETKESAKILENLEGKKGDDKKVVVSTVGAASPETPLPGLAWATQTSKQGRLDSLQIVEHTIMHEAPQNPDPIARGLWKITKRIYEKINF